MQAVAIVLLASAMACDLATEPADDQNNPPPATHGQIRLQVDGGTCSQKVVNVDAFIDGQQVGTLQPGAGVITKLVPIGNHTIAATGQRLSGGTANWSPNTKYVPAEGTGVNFTCS